MENYVFGADSLVPAHSPRDLWWKQNTVGEWTE